MGLGIELTDCNGKLLERVDDPRNFLHRLLPAANDDSGCVLAKIDWYGDTYFNYLQIKGLLEEWDQLAQIAEKPEQSALIEGVRRLAVQAQKHRGLLRFIGD